LTSVQIWFESIQNPWFRAVGLNFEPFDQIPNFLFRNGLNLFKIGNSLKFKSLDLNFISDPSPTLISERMSKIFSFESNFWVGIQIPFVEIPYSLIWVFKSVSKFYLKNIPNLEFNFIWSKPLDHCPNSYFWEYPKVWFGIIQVFFWIHSSQQPNNPKSIFPIHSPSWPKPPSPPPHSPTSWPSHLGSAQAAQLATRPASSSMVGLAGHCHQTGPWPSVSPQVQPAL
jgi:hypothetical protein